jgi:hypothetical protein
MENMGDKVYAFTATLPGREVLLFQALRSILPQVDTVQVVLNNFAQVPSELIHPKITVKHHDNRLEDGSRFLGIENAPKGRVFVFDDDIIYPPDYVSWLVNANGMNRKSMVCPMGKILHPRPIKSYYKDCKYIKAFCDVLYDVRVDVPGACGILWNNQEIKVHESDMLIPNSDLCLAKVCKDQEADAIVVAHKADWLTNLWTGEVTKQPSIYGKYRRNDEIQTDFVNMFL